ncbi:hypothetical protein HNR40_010360 [Nonomuraea endophytica]|uniref:Uncharacterized protein n=1 Tax=Nonomuraea endophytica TaxID=714136 RepID=A0A7W8EMB9_9ACTN|nr:hypothetical protein [Nonomuraea endophytica]
MGPLALFHDRLQGGGERAHVHVLSV